MSQVSTVRGPVEVADLGPTYMHEHIFVLTADVQQNYPGEWGSEDERITDAVAKLGALAAQGVRTIVDPTVVGLGRNLPRIQRVAEQVPELNIIVATGLYTYDSVPFFFYHRGPALNEALGTEVPDPMVDMFTGDITEGITGTGVRAGMLKCAIDEQGMTPAVERVMPSQRAASALDWIDPNVLPFLPQWHYLHIHDEVLPYAREHGVTEEQIATMLTANPRRLFEQTR